jgi:hypothetical protein
VTTTTRYPAGQSGSPRTLDPLHPRVVAWRAHRRWLARTTYTPQHELATDGLFQVEWVDTAVRLFDFGQGVADAVAEAGEGAA